MKHATVIIPTHNHEQTLISCVESVRSQTIDNIEICIVGDGTTDRTREIVEGLTSADSRIHFYDFPKGDRLGEQNRNQVLAETTGTIITYLADDDLYHPQHVEQMLELLKNADFASTSHLRINEDSTVHMGFVDLTKYDRDMMIVHGTNKVPLACGAHTRRFFEQLQFGWRTTPKRIPTDLYMWQQFLSRPDCRAVSGFQPTVVKFPARYSTDSRTRFTEMEQWRELFKTPHGLGKFTQICLKASIESACRQLEEKRVEFENRRVSKIRNVVMRSATLRTSYHAALKMLLREKFGQSG